MCENDREYYCLKTSSEDSNERYCIRRKVFRLRSIWKNYKIHNW